MGRFLVLFFICVLFSFCIDERPRGVIPREKMASVLTDLHIANAYVTSAGVDKAKQDVELVYRSMYRKHATDSITIRKSINYYAQQPEVLKEIYKQVKSNLNELEKAEQKKQSVLKKRRQADLLKKKKTRLKADSLKARKLSNPLRIKDKSK